MHDKLHPAPARIELSRPLAFLHHPLGRIFVATLATFLWGSAFPAVKVGYGIIGIQKQNTFLQLEFAGYRFVLAALLLILLSAVVNRGAFTLNKRHILAVVKVGSAQTFLQYIFFYVGIGLSSGIDGAIIASSITFFQLGLAHLMYHDDKVSLRKIGAAAIGFIGILFYHVMKNGMVFSFGMGEACMFAAMFFAALGNLFNRQTALPVLPLTAFQMLLGGVGLVCVGALQVGFAPFDLSFQFLLILLYLSLVSAASFFLWNSIMAHNKAGSVSVYLFLVPIFGVTLSALVLGEKLDWFVFPALLLIAVSIFIAHRAAPAPSN